MDELLRSRKMGSASARRKKMRAREEERMRATGEHEAKICLYGYNYYSDEEELSDLEDNMNTFSPIPDSEPDRSTTVRTPSTTGLQTPDEVPSPPALGTKQLLSDDVDRQTITEAPAKTGAANKLDLEGDVVSLTTPTSTQPVLTSTLTTPADFMFDLYAPAFISQDLDSSSVECDSPIETAKSVIYSQPRMRPSVISIKSISASSVKSRESSLKPPTPASKPLSSPAPPTIRPPVRPAYHIYPTVRPPKSIETASTYTADYPSSLSSGKNRLSVTSTASGFPACEATRLEIQPPPPVPPLCTDRFRGPGKDPSRCDAKSTPNNSHSKKPSLFLRRTNSFRRSGSNAKNQPKDVNSRSGESIRSRPDIRMSGTEVDEANMAGRRSVADEHTVRPRTAATPSASFWRSESVTALPEPPDMPVPTVTKSNTFDVSRKISISALRSRSSSIGRALRSASSSVIPTVPPPPRPSLNIPRTESGAQSRAASRKGSMDQQNFFAPPVSPRSFASGRSRGIPSSPAMGHYGWPKNTYHYA